MLGCGERDCESSRARVAKALTFLDSREICPHPHHANSPGVTNQGCMTENGARHVGPGIGHYREVCALKCVSNRLPEEVGVVDLLEEVAILLYPFDTKSID